MFMLRLLLSLSLVAGYQAVQATGSETMPTTDTTMPTLSVVTTGAVVAAIEAQNPTPAATKTPTSPATPIYQSRPCPYGRFPNGYVLIQK